MAGGRPNTGNDNSWDWENTWFNPFQSEYLARKKEQQAREAAQNALQSRDRTAWERVYGKGSFDPFYSANQMVKALGPPANTQTTQSEADTGGLTYDELLDAIAGRMGGGGGGGYSGPSIADLTGQINESYDRRLGALSQNKASAVSAIQNIAKQYATDLQQNQMSYQQGVEAINAEIARRAADMAQRTSGTAQELANASALEGGNAQVLRAQAANIASAQEQANQFQRDLAARTAQIAAENFRNAQNAGQMVQQGALGNVEASYTQILNALQNAREQEIMQLSAAPRSSGGGGGTTYDIKDVIDAANSYLRGAQSLQEIQSGNEMMTIQALMGAAQRKDPAGFLAFIQSLPPEEKKKYGF